MKLSIDHTSCKVQLENLFKELLKCRSWTVKEAITSRNLGVKSTAQKVSDVHSIILKFPTVSEKEVLSNHHIELYTPLAQFQFNFIPRQVQSNFDRDFHIWDFDSGGRTLQGTLCSLIACVNNFVKKVLDLDKSQRDDFERVYVQKTPFSSLRELLLNQFNYWPVLDDEEEIIFNLQDEGDPEEDFELRRLIADLRNSIAKLFPDDEEIHMKMLEKGIRQEIDTYLETISLRLKNSKQIILRALEISGATLRYASPELQNCEEVVLKGLNAQDLKGSSESEDLFQFASERLRDNPNFVGEAIKGKYQRMRFASERIKSSKEIMWELIEINPGIIVYTSKGILDDKGMIYRAMQTQRLSS